MAADLSDARALAGRVAREWGIDLGPPFEQSRYSYVAAAGENAVLKVPAADDDESLHEAEALALWHGDGAVRLHRRSGRALLLERARPGTDISDVPDEEAMAIAVELGRRLWRRAGAPFRPVLEYVRTWLADEERDPDPGARILLPLARELLGALPSDEPWLVHGDFHHHNVLRHGDGYVAIDPKPYLADREYDVYPWLCNPLSYNLADRERTERRITAFVAAGLDDFRIRAWAVVRGTYLVGDADGAAVLRSLLE